MDKLRACLDTLFDGSHTRICVLGDFENTKDSRDLGEMMEIFNLHAMFAGASRVTDTSILQYRTSYFRPYGASHKIDKVSMKNQRK